MLIQNPMIQDALRRIVSLLSADKAMQEDLLQEAMIRLWKLEGETPGRTRSWYLQNCRFHLQHLLAFGRSVDAIKRDSTDKRIPIDTMDHDQALEGYDTNGELMETVIFHDIVETLSRCLKPRESAVLGGLADGLALSEVAARVKLSYPTALKYRRKIAAVATKLGIAPLPINRPPKLSAYRRRKNGSHDSMNIGQNGTKQFKSFAWILTATRPVQSKFNGQVHLTELKPVNGLSHISRTSMQRDQPRAQAA